MSTSALDKPNVAVIIATTVPHFVCGRCAVRRRTMFVIQSTAAIIVITDTTGRAAMMSVISRSDAMRCLRHERDRTAPFPRLVRMRHEFVYERSDGTGEGTPVRAA